MEYSHFSKPKDLLYKLHREARKANFANSHENLADHIFNFSITAHSLRDWTINELGLETKDEKRLFHEYCNTNYPGLALSRDIANSLKHFSLTRFTSTVNGVTDQISEMVNLIPDVAGKNEKLEIRPTVTIQLSSGEESHLQVFLWQVCKSWRSIFDEKGFSYEMDKANDLVWAAS